MKTKEITPRSMQCGVGVCPAIFEAEEVEEIINIILEGADEE